jgi:dihydrolipoamide dehydrogenase
MAAGVREEGDVLMATGDVRDQAEVVVVGGGPGGYAAAFHAADLGKEVALVELESRLGGVCLLRGCIPSKALISAAEFYQRIQHAEEMGIIVQGGVRLDMKKLGGWRDSIIDDLTKGIDALCKSRGVRRFVGRGRLTGPNDLTIVGPKEETSQLRFKLAILAVGSRPVMPAPFQRGPRVLTSDEALGLNELPASLLVVGGGYIGIELGSCFAALGCKVTIVELMDRLLMGTDADLVRVVRQHLEKRGVAMHLEAKVTECVEKKDGVHVKVEPKEGNAWSGQFDKVLVAIGRRPNTDDMGLDRAGVQLNDKGFIPVDSKCRTNVPHIFAIGDCTGTPYLAHRARRQGVVAAEVLAGKPSEFDNRTIPAVVFSDPEIAYCGLSEEEAKKAGYEVKVGRFRFAASGRAKSLGQPDGFVAIIAEAGTEVVLGVRMVGPNVSELIGEATLAIETGAVLEDLIATIHVHPTLGEAIQDAAEGVRGHAIHSVRVARKK